MRKYEIDSDKLDVREARFNFGRLLLRFLAIALGTLAFAVLGYCILALCYDTRTERSLKEYCRNCEENYESILEDEALLDDVVAGLQYKDCGIYKDVFHSDAPNANPMDNLDFLFGSDTIPERKFIVYATAKADELEARAEHVDRLFMQIFTILAREGSPRPPMSPPLENFEYPQVGAGPGMKYNLFYRAESMHRGLDLIASQGEPVYSPAAGTVKMVKRSAKFDGNVVEITHPGGYSTYYAHLSDILVRPGQRVRVGQQIGEVGMSGRSFAPHLHYEVRKDTLNLNPVNYMFVSLDPAKYCNMLFMSANTIQSMD